MKKKSFFPWFCQTCGKKQPEGTFGNEILWPKNPDVAVRVCDKCYKKLIRKKEN